MPRTAERTPATLTRTCHHGLRTQHHKAGMPERCGTACRLPPLALYLLISGSLLSTARAAPVPAAAVITQTYNMAVLQQNETAPLLSTYLSYQGSPFSDPGFSAPELQISGLPTAAISYRAWRALSDVDRLTQSYQAFSILDEFFQLVLDDQKDLNPDKASLLELLKKTKRGVQGLLSNLTSVMDAMGILVPAVPDPLMAASISSLSFQKKVRGYVLCREHRSWMERTVRDFSFLKDKYPV